MGGLARIAKMYGGMVINGKEYVWDYARDEAVPKSDMTREQWAASEKAKYAALQAEVESVRAQPDTGDGHE